MLNKLIIKNQNHVPYNTSLACFVANSPSWLLWITSSRSLEWLIAEMKTE